MLRRYKCVKCEHEDVYFEHEVKVCEKCGSHEMTRQLSVPLASKNVNKVDKYHNVEAIDGIEQDLKARTAQHNLDTLDEMIEEFGIEQAKINGWLIYDEAKKEWRKRTKWDIGLLNKQNSGSAPIKAKK